MLSVLSEQLDAHRARRRTEAEARARYHQALQAYVASVEQVVQGAMEVFEAISQAGRSIAASTPPDRDVQAQRIIAAFDEFLRESEEELQEVLRLEKRGYPIARSDEFKAALAEARAYVRGADRFLAAAKSLDEGKGRPLEEAMNELRHHRQ